MANFEDLADKLKPLMLEDEKFQEGLRKNVIIDVDVKEAKASFKSMDDMLESLRTAIKEAESLGKDTTSMYENLGKTAGVAIAVIGEKFKQANEEIKKATSLIASNQEVLDEYKNKGVKNSDYLKTYEESNATLRKIIEERNELVKEYQSQSEILANPEKKKQIEDEKAQEKLRKSAFADSDVGEAKSEFESMYKTLDGIRASIKEAESLGQDTTSMYESLGKAESDAIVVIDEKYKQTTEDIERMTEQIAYNQEVLDEYKGIENSEFLQTYKDANDKFRKLIEEKKALAEEYQAQSEIMTNPEKREQYDRARAEEEARALEQAQKEAEEASKALESETGETGATDALKSDVEAREEVVAEYKEQAEEIADANKSLQQQIQEEPTQNPTPNDDSQIVDPQKIEEASEQLDNIKEEAIELKEQVEEATQQIAESQENIDTSGGENESAFVAKIEEENEQLKEAVEERKELAEEYKEQVGQMDGASSGQKQAFDKAVEDKVAEDPRTKLGKYMGEADTSWVTKEISSAKELKGLYDLLLEEKRSIEEQKTPNMMSDAELKNYAEVAAAFNRVSEMLYGEVNKFKGEATKASKEVAKTTQDVAKTIDKATEDSKNSVPKNGKVPEVHNKSIEDYERQKAEQAERMRQQQEMRDKAQKMQGAEPETGLTYKQLLDEIKKKKDEITNSKFALGKSSDVQGDVERIKKLEKELANLQKTKQAYQESTPKGMFSGLAEKIGGVGGIFGGITNEEGGKVGSVIAMSLKKALGGALKGVGKLGVGALKGAFSGALKGLNFGGKMFSGLINGAKQAMSVIANLASKGFGMLKSAVSTTLGNMKRLVSGGFNAVKKGASAVKNGFNTVKSAMHSITKKATPNILKSFSSIKSMLMRRIKRTFISAIFNQAKEGLQQLAKSSEEFNQSMSNIKNSAKQASGNLSIVLGNLLTTVEPIITTLLGYFNQLLEAINGVFAMLSGKKTMLVAKQSTDDYAKSLKSASGSAKDLNKQLYGFDEITRQEDNSSGSSGGGKVEYEEKELDSLSGGINDFFREVVEAFQASQFDRVGSLIAEQLNSIVGTVDNFINKIRPKAVEWSGNIATIFNGFVDGWDAHATGDLLGDGLNLIADVVNTFLSKFDFGDLGRKFGDGIRGIFDSVDFNLLGETIANWFNMLPRFLSGLFENMPWGDIGSKFAQGLTSLFNNIDWDARKEMFVRGINGVLTTLNNFITGINWGDLTRRFVEHVKGIINGINWDNGENSLVQTVLNGINGLLDSFEALIDSKFFTTIAVNLGKAVGGILKGISWSRLASDIVLGLLELRNAFWEFVNQIDFPELAKNIGSAISGLFENKSITDGFAESSKKVGEGINSIIKAFNILINGDENGKGKIDFDNIAKVIGEGIKTLLGSINFEELITAIGDGAIKISTAFANLVSKIFERGVDENGHQTRSLGERLAYGINNIFYDASGKLDTAKFEGLGKSIGSAIHGILVNILDLVKEVDWGSVIQAFFTTIESVFNEVFGDVEGKGNLGDKFAEALNSIFSDDNVKKKGVFDKVGKSIGKMLSQLFTNVASFIGNVDYGNVLKSVTDVFTGIFSALTDPNNGAFKKENMENIAKGITKFITGAFDSISSLVDGLDLTGLVNGIITLIQNLDFNKIITSFINMIKDGVDKIISDAPSILSTLVTTVINVIKNIKWDELITSLFELLAPDKIFDFLWKLLTEVDWLGLAGSIIDALWTGIKSALRNVLNAGGKLLNKILELLGLSSGELEEETAETLTHINESVKNAVSNFNWESAGVSLDVSAWLNMKEQASYGEVAKRIFGDYFNSQGLKTAVEDELRKGMSNLFEGSGLSVSEELLTAMQRQIEATPAEKRSEVMRSFYSLIADGVDQDEMLQMMNARGFNENMADWWIYLLDWTDSTANNMTYKYSQFVSTVLEGINKETDIFLDTMGESKDYKSAFEKYGITISEGFNEALGQLEGKELKDKIRLVLSSVNTDFLTAIDKAQSGKEVREAFSKYGFDITEGLADALKGVGAENISTAIELLGMGVEQDVVQALASTNLDANLREFMDKTGASIDQVVALLTTDSCENMEAIVSALGYSLGEDLGMTVPEALKKALQEGVKSVEKAAEGVAEVADTSTQREGMGENAEESAETVTETTSETLENGADDVGESAETVTNAVDEKFKALPEEVKPYAEQMLDYIATALSENNEGILQSVVKAVTGDVITNVQTILSKDKGADITKTFLEGMRDGIIKNKEELVINQFNAVATEAMEGFEKGMNGEKSWVIYYARDISQDVRDALADYMNWGEGYDIGYHIMEGLQDGLEVNRKAIHNVAYNVALDLVTTMKNVLQIKSPSRVFEQIGDYSMQGLQVGLEGQEGAVLGSISNIANAITEEMQCDTELGYTFDSATNGLNNVVDSLSDVASQFVAVAQAIERMGGIEIPTVASGQVIPYRAKIDTESIHTEENSIMNDRNELEDVLYSAIMRAFGNSNNNQNINVYLDGQHLTNVVDKYQRQQARAWGV